MAKIRLRLVVDKEKNRVVHAESGSDFVDVLFSFLTLPMGTIIKLLGKKSELGCMDKLYESVENLDEQSLQTRACRTMLLEPRSESERLCEHLMLNPNDFDPRRLYRCANFVCFSKTHKVFSTVRGARCRCGKAMDKKFEWVRKEVGCGQEGVFLNGGPRLIISDDLHVTPASMGATISLLQKLGIHDAEALETRTVDIDRDELLRLLKRFLLSKTPLTNVFLRKSRYVNGSSAAELELIDPTQMKSASDSKKVSMHLFESASSYKVMFAEAGEGLVDTLFSFLTFPLGAIVKLLDKHSSIKCADNLYDSVEVLASLGDYIKSEVCKNKLLSPKLSAYFGCSSQPLEIGENQPTGAKVHECKHNIGDTKLTMINPKLPNSGIEYGGGYVKKPVRFMVSREMIVTPLSPNLEIDVIKELKEPINSIVGREVVLEETEVAKLLKACLISRMALSDVFSHKKRRRHPKVETSV